jgi:uncharacterized membrane protein
MEELQSPGDEIGPAPRWAVLTTGVLVLLGLGIASYMTYVHLHGVQSLVCAGNGIVNCAKVTTSAQSRFLGLPVSELGLGYFLVAIILYNPIAWRSKHRIVHLARLAMAIGAMAFVLWLLYAELIIIRSICEWCTGVHVITFALFAITMLVVPPMLSARAENQSTSA